MAFQYLTNIPLEQAVVDYMRDLREHGMQPREETVPTADACGRITARPIYARISAPHYHACAMDGIALEASSTFGATETTPVLLEESSFMAVDTGDPLPEGCDAVVMIEDVVSAEGGVLLYAAATPWQHIRQIGEDICAGEMVLTSFTEITPAATGALLACGVLEVPVYRRPVVGIIPTGDEIVPPSAHPGSGDIIEFNSSIFAGMLRPWGAEPKRYPICKDQLDGIISMLRTALSECDAVILNAGSSAGREDYAAEAIRAVGEVLYHGVAIRPGKPAILGRAGARPILGVPGYPVSGIIVLEEILRPVVLALCGRGGMAPPHATAVLSRPFESSLKYQEFVRVRLGRIDGRLIAVPLQRGAGVVSSFVKADGLMDVPQDVEGYEAGSSVRVQLLKPPEEIGRTLVITGSHDPLIDEIAELLKQEDRDTQVASSHVGSMGGIMAIRRGEAHMAGIHLLDEETGDYNTPYITRYFPQGGVKAIECVQRVQGLMVRPGNPKGIRSLRDLLLPGMRYVNRQRGSGTRILCDYLCRQGGVDTSAIYGYEREEYTHTAVAALIDANSADAGMGIYPAARAYGLDFIPICTEQYDFLILESAYDTPAVQRALRVIAGDAFKERLNALGGYTFHHPGRVYL